VDAHEQRKYPRGTVALATIVSPRKSGPVVGVIDVSEGGACIEWSPTDAIEPGTPVRLCFLLGDDQTVEVDGTMVRIGYGRAGVQFLPHQEGVVRLVLAEVRSDE
jgi:hypothetical protein